jgi:hypothetical protein
MRVSGSVKLRVTGASRVSTLKSMTSSFELGGGLSEFLIAISQRWAEAGLVLPAHHTVLSPAAQQTTKFEITET